MNNNRDWFTEHKEQYIRTLYEPMKALGADLYAPFLDRPGNILKVSRIYRDARLHHPDPYKESLWICIRQDCDWWAENPCLFFEIRPEGVSYGFSLWHPRTSVMADFRSRIAADPGRFLDLIAATEQTAGQEVCGEAYKRSRFPAEDPRLQKYFDWKTDISCIRQEDVSDAMFGPALGERAREFLTGLIPLYDYFNMVCAGQVR